MQSWLVVALSAGALCRWWAPLNGRVRGYGGLHVTPVPGFRRTAGAMLCLICSIGLPFRSLTVVTSPSQWGRPPEPEAQTPTAPPLPPGEPGKGGQPAGSFGSSRHPAGGGPSGALPGGPAGHSWGRLPAVRRCGGGGRRPAAACAAGWQPGHVAQWQGAPGVRCAFGAENRSSVGCAPAIRRMVHAMTQWFSWALQRCRLFLSFL